MLLWSLKPALRAFRGLRSLPVLTGRLTTRGVGRAPQLPTHRPASKQPPHQGRPASTEPQTWGARGDVTERARAHSYVSSKEVQKTYQI